MNEKILEARREFRKIQMELGQHITPTLSILVSNMWERALEKDPSGDQLMDVVANIRELLTPMKS